MQTITLNDGTVLNGSALDSPDGSYVLIYITGITIIEGFQLFSDPDRTAHIVYTSYGNEITYDGYTDLSSINTEFGNCNLKLKKVI